MNLSPSQRSPLPVNNICTWGRKESDFLEPPPAKTAPIAYFNDHGIAPEHREFVKEFIAIMGPERIHSYSQLSNRAMPMEAGASPCCVCEGVSECVCV